MIDVTDDFYLFSDALRSLVPIMERSGIQWRNDGQYDEFYYIADGLFRGLIISKFSDDQRYCSIFEPYVYAMKKPGVARFIVLDTETGDKVGEFRRFISSSIPFDVIEIDSDKGLITREFSSDKIRISTE
jgi:hypothetical protein